VGAFEDAQIRAIVRAVEGFTERVIIRLALNITDQLIRYTPVDTGWARANWVPSIGASSDSPATSQPTPSLVASASSSQAAGQAGLLSYKLPRGSIFISNNVPYIGRLNDGSSAQAPAGFVQASIRRGISNTEAQVR